MSVFSCLRRPSSKEKQSSISNTLMHNTVSVDEKQVVGGRSQSTKGGYSFTDDGTTVNRFRFSKTTKICAYIFVV